MNKMFSGCRSLNELDLSNFNINNVKDMRYMFNNCSSLIELKIPDLDIGNKIKTSYMFNGCDLLKNYYIFIWKFNVKSFMINLLFTIFVIIFVLIIIINAYGFLYN